LTERRSDDKVFRTVCRSCHGGCGALVHVRDGRVVRVQGDPASPMSKGWMCIKGLSAAELTNHPDRLRRPLRRKGERGSGQWEIISWNDALGEISARIDRIRRDFGPESIALGQGTSRHHYMHVVGFANALGTPNWYEPGFANCFVPRVVVSRLMYGGHIVADYYGQVNPKCILFGGHNPLVSSADGELGISAKRALDKGAIGIAVDPRRSETAQRCEQWLPVRPGTDAALTLAMIHVVIKQEMYDADFVEKWTVGFDKLTKHVEPFTPEWAEKITWVPGSAIEAAAKTYASSKPAVLEGGVSLEPHPNSLQTVRAVAILRALTGNIDVPGGDIVGSGLSCMYSTLNDQLPEEAAREGKVIHELGRHNRRASL
jgi:thiosulfate reductase/polysulfide reductase chain A